MAAFCMILPSSSSTARFPTNNASKYSVAVDDAEELKGNWEVAIAQMTYSNCLYTFNNETIKVEQPRTLVTQCDYGCRVTIPTTTENRYSSKWPKDIFRG